MDPKKYPPLSELPADGAWHVSLGKHEGRLLIVRLNESADRFRRHPELPNQVGIAIRSTNALTGVDWCSSNNSPPCAVGQIGVPLLVSAMGGNTGLRDNESLHEMAASRDKDFFVLEGATHNIDPCVECETRKGEYANSVRNFFNYVRDWMNNRFAR